ncbi:MAG TPA: hypothetical protein VGF59_13725 [Bryobacteraceae bacterium]|jgi:hypothetical protein
MAVNLSKSPELFDLRDRLPRRISELKRERARLEEEILQLRAAVKIWTEVCEQIAHTAKANEQLTNVGAG